MDAYKLDRVIQIYTRAVASSSDSPAPAYGEPLPTYTLFATVYAEVKTLSGREYFAADQQIAEDLTEFNIRWMSGINAQCRVVFAGQNYDVRAVHEIGRRDGLRLIATVQNATS